MRDLRPLAAKAAAAVLREVGRAPEQVAARRLGPVPEGSGPRILFLTPRSWAVHVQWEAIVGRSLASRGADVRFATCGGDRPVCDRTHVYEGPPMPCRTCTGYTHRSLDAHGHRWAPLRGATGTEPAWDGLEQLDLEGLRAATWRGAPLGRLVEVPVKWYLCSTDLEGDPLGLTTYRRFLRSAAAIHDEAAATLERERPDTVVMLNGLFLFEQVARWLCDRAQIDVVTYERGYVRDTVFFQRGSTASRYETEPLWATIREQPLSAAAEEELDAYLHDREVGARSISDFWPAPRFDEPTPGFAVLFTNVTWDTAVQGRDRCFGGSTDWLTSVIRWFADRPDRRLIVRAHPAEVRSPKARSREPVTDIVARAFPNLPGNVRVIPPDDPTSSYPLMAAADVALVYTSTAGMEAALRGTPAITAGDAQFSRKGFTFDPEDRAGYFATLESVLADPAGHRPDVETARRYAHFFFFRAALRTAAWASEPVPGLVRITSDPAVVRPGGDHDLDVICEGILEGKPFFRG